MAEQREEKETPAGYKAISLFFELSFGKPVEVRQQAAATLAISKNRDMQCTAASLLALAGDEARAQALADKIAKQFPEDTNVRFDCLPMVAAQLALNRKDPAGAIGSLQATAPFEAGFGHFYPTWLRGQAYLMQRDGNLAAAEFQKVIDHRGVVANSFWGALARLGLARAYALQGYTAKAGAAYQDFLTLWKDAEPDIPVLKEAKAEYLKLQ